MSLLKNSSIVMIGVVISNLLAYAFHFIAGRMLGPEDYGEFGALMALFLVVALPAGALSSAITKFTSKFSANDQPGLIATLRKKIQNDVLILSGILLFLFILFSTFIAKYLKIDSNVPVIIVAITLVFAFLLPINRGILQGLKKFRIFSWNNVVEAFSRLLLLIVFLYFGFGVNGAILAYGLAYLIAFLMIFPYITETDSKSGDKLNLKPVYNYIVLVLVVNLLMQSLINVPSLFIKHYYSSEFTGYWTAALNIARVSMFITGSISMVMFPEIAGTGDNVVKWNIFKKAALLVFVSSAGIALVFFLFPMLFVSLLYGSAFWDAGILLKWMGLVMIGIGLLQLWANYQLAKWN